ncbi:MAG TPA: hypothetical protein VF442_08700, partial [Sphingobium sp.]
SDMPLPSILAQAKPVVWASEVRFGNHLGGLINRMGGRKARFRALAAEQAMAIAEQATAQSADKVATPAEP